MSSPDPMLLEAIEAHQAGRTADAKAMYEDILSRSPSDPDALNFLGMLEHTSGHHARGIELLQRSLDSAPGNAHAWTNLGNMLVAAERLDEASQAYARATELAPDQWQGWFNHGALLRRLKRLEEAVECFEKAVSLQPASDLAYKQLGVLLYLAGRFEDMARLYADWARYNPDSPIARHMLAATTGQGVPDRASDEYVRFTFDSFAETFDENLAHLGYRAPQILAPALERHLPADHVGKVDILDAGVGTGLSGPLLRPLAKRLVGVDLSAKMLEKARDRGAYDELELGELCGFMRARPASFDAVLSADTLVYFGALEEALAAANECLRPGGLLAFTVERWDEPGAGDRFRMGPHGRYQHSAAYVRAALEAAGFSVVEMTEEVLRSELGTDVQGLAVVARR